MQHRRLPIPKVKRNGKRALPSRARVERRFIAALYDEGSDVPALGNTGLPQP